MESIHRLGKKLDSNRNNIPNVRRIQYHLDAIYKDLSDQINCLQKALANLRKDLKEIHSKI